MREGRRGGGKAWETIWLLVVVMMNDMHKSCFVEEEGTWVS